MKNVSLRLIVLKAGDVEQVVAFYESLGLKFKAEQHGRGPLHHAASMGEGVLEIYPLPAADQAADSTTRLGFAIADPDNVIENAPSVGGRVIQAAKETPWGYMALVEDPDGRKVELYRA